jgi:lipoprotein-releasing system permease protein
LASIADDTPEAGQASGGGAFAGAAPFGALERMIAGRYLRSRRREAVISVISILSFLGIMLGVATLITVMAVMNGFRTELISKILGVNGHMLVQPVEQRLTDYEAVAGRLEGVDGVIQAIPYVEGQALVSAPGGATGALMRGLSREDLAAIPLVANNVMGGTLEDFGPGRTVAIGSRLARTLGVTVGQSITLVSPDGAVTPFGVTPRMESFEVVAVFEVGMSEFDSSILYMPIRQAQLFFNQEGAASAIELFVADPDAVGELRAPVQTAAERPVFVTDWRFRNTTFFSALEVERNMMFIILTLIVFVAALNIISGMTMLVKDKARDIAILRTMGASRGAVLRIFMMAGFSIGVAGTAAGFVLGLVLCHNIEGIRQFVSWLTRTELFSPELYFLSRMTADINSGETIAVVAMSLILSFAATLYPSWKAAATDPVVALRAE